MLSIVLEGIDGCGKSTQSKRLVEKLGSKFWKFPNKDTPTGRLIYSHLARDWRTRVEQVICPAGFDDDTLDATVFQALQVMNRLEVAQELDKDMKGPRDVVMDRYWPSGYAYGSAEGLDGEYLINVHSMLPQPDVFLLLDVDVKDSKERRPERRDRYEENSTFMTLVAQNYRNLWKTMSARTLTSKQEWIIINARNGVEDTAKAVLDAVVHCRGLRNGDTHE